MTGTTFALMALVVFYAPPALAAAALPSPPQYFYGTLKIDGADAPAGTTVEARTVGVLNGPFNPIVTDQPGRYSDTEPPFTYGLLVQGDISEGATIEFYVNNMKANETAAWRSGQFTMLNLTVGSIAPALSINTGAFSSAGPAAAILYGNLAHLGGAASVTVSFQWGTSQAYGKETTPQTLNTPGTFSATITGLLPNAIYHYRAKAVAGQTVVYGANQAFTTGVAILLSATTGAASSIGTTTATLNGNLAQLANAASAQMSFQWGTTIAYGNETPAQTLTAPGAFSATITGLLPDTVYHFRSKAVTGQTVVFGADATFRTTASFTGGGGGSIGGGVIGGGGGLFTLPLTGLSGVGPLVDGVSTKTLNAVRVKTADDKLSLEIAAGTRMVDRAGMAVTSLTAAPLAAPPSPPAGKAALAAYELGPSGARFDPPLTLTLSFDPAKVPAGFPSEKLHIAWWNGAEWVGLSSTVDLAASTVTALVPHFTAFAVIAEPDAAESPTGETSPPPSAPPQTQETPPDSPPAETPASPGTQEASEPSPPETPEQAPSPGAPPAQTNWWLIAGIAVMALVVIVETMILLRRRTTKG